MSADGSWISNGYLLSSLWFIYFYSFFFLVIRCAANKSPLKCLSVGFWSCSEHLTVLLWTLPKLFDMILAEVEKEVSGVLNLFRGLFYAIICKVRFSGPCQTFHTQTTSMLQKQHLFFGCELCVLSWLIRAFTCSKLPRCFCMCLSASVLCERTQSIVQMKKNIAVKWYAIQQNKQ